MHSLKATSLILVSAAVLTACQPTRTAYHDVSKDELLAEQKIQQKMFSEKELDKEYISKANRIKQQQRLNKVSKPIAKAAIDLCDHLSRSGEGCATKFVLAEKGGINAWADGEKISITPSMMNFAKTDEELATVLGHELAHHSMKHVAVKKTNMSLATFIGHMADKVAGKYGVTTSGGFQKIGQAIGSVVYSKSLEREADYVGLYITHAAGFDINNSAKFWRKMSMRDEKAIYSAVTHPTNPERFVALTKTIKEINQKIAANEELVPSLIIKSAAN